MKQNCWEVKKCGREKGGSRADELGVCPAATDKRFNGFHDGKNAGRCCWVVAGTYCEGKVQGTFAAKIDDCIQCEFYKKVVDEEGSEFLFARQIHKKLK